MCKVLVINFLLRIKLGLYFQYDYGAVQAVMHFDYEISYFGAFMTENKTQI